MRIILVLMLSSLALTGCFGLGEAVDSRSASDQRADTVTKPNEQTVDPKTEGSKVESDSTVNTPAQGNERSQDQVPKSNSNMTETKESSPSNSTSQSTGSTTSDSTVTEESIKEKYKGQLTQLQSYYIGKLNSLYGGASTDLKEGKLSRKEISSKYVGTANALKEESQAKVNQTLEAMKEELNSVGAPTNSVDQFRSSYYAAVNQAKEDVMAKVKAAVGM